jgi:MoxR-like ATPase
MRMSLGYPAFTDEKEMVERFQLRHPIETLQPVTTPDAMTRCQEAVRGVTVTPAANDYILKIVRATREHPALLLGSSPRGSLGLFRAAQALAALDGKNAVSVGQVKQIAEKVLAHRLIVLREEKYRNVTVAGVVAEILAQVPMPS